MEEAAEVGIVTIEQLLSWAEQVEATDAGEVLARACP